MVELVTRAALVLLVAGVFLQVAFGLASPQKIHTPRYRRPWGMQAATVRRFGPRLVAFRMQVVIV